MGKLFVVTRNDLPLAYQAVQSGHAVAQWMLENKDHLWQNNTLVYLTVKDEAHLDMLCEKLKMFDYSYSEFIEPDINNQRTAIACYTDSGVFSKFKMMGE